MQHECNMADFTAGIFLEKIPTALRGRVVGEFKSLVLNRCPTTLVDLSAGYLGKNVDAEPRMV